MFPFAWNAGMSNDLNPTVLLRRIARLESTVGRLNEDLGRLRSEVGSPGRQATATRSLRAQTTRAKASKGGLARAAERGEAARVGWVRDGLIVPGEQLAQAW